MNAVARREVDETDHSQLLRELHLDLEEKGFFAPSWLWSWKLLFWIPTLGCAYLALILAPRFSAAWWVLLPIAAMAMLTMGFVGHDAGHGALSRRAWVNELWGQIGMSALCGMSFGYWRPRHNQHHVHCQEQESDPDMHFGVLFSVYPGSDSWHSRLGRFFLRIQKWAFWPLASFYWVALRYDGLRDLFQQPKVTRIDRFFIPLHYLLLIVLPGLFLGWAPTLIAYLAVSCLSSLATASVFIPNHIGMRRLVPGQQLSYLEQQVTTSRNITNPRLFDFYFGGLNSQIEHHLFPRVAHYRLRDMRPAVRAFCERHDLGYAEASFLAALGRVGGHLGEMTEEFKLSNKAA